MRDRRIQWFELHLPLPLNSDGVRAAIRGLAGVSNQPRVVLEATGRAGQIRWHLACEIWAHRRVLHALADQLPDLRWTALPSALDGLRTTGHLVAARFIFRGDRALRLACDTVEPAARGLLGALSRARSGESVTLQLILGPRRRPGGPFQPTAGERQADRRRKRAEHRVLCEVRCGATTAATARSRSLVEEVVGNLRALEVPGVRLAISRARPVSFDQARSPLFWGNSLSVSDLVPLAGWPIGRLPLPGVASAHPKQLPAPSSLRRGGRVLGVSSLDPDRAIALSQDDSLRHLHLIGPTGVGKSTVMAQLALADMVAGGGVVVIDPKGDLITDLLARIPKDRHDDVVLLDARDPAPVGINGLHQPAQSDLAADTLLAVFSSLYADSWGPRTHDILHACLLTLARRGDGSLAMVPLLLTNPGFRRSITSSASRRDPLGLGAFWAWYEAISDAERTSATAPLMNKLRPILLRPELRAIFGQRAPRFALDDVFTHRRILLVNLAKGAIGSDGARLLGSMVVSLLWAAALRRSSQHASQRRPVMIHIDEVQDYLRLPGDLGDALAQARGLGVGFTLAHQHLGQLPRNVREAVLANARSRMVFQTTGKDARDFAALTGGVLESADFAALPAFQAYASLLEGNAPTGWTNLLTKPLDPATIDPHALRQRSATRYGQPLVEIEEDLLTLTNPNSLVVPTEAGEGAASFGRTHRITDAASNGASEVPS